MPSGDRDHFSVLIVDDNRAARMMAQRVLERVGLDNIAVESGEQALEVLWSRSCDLVLMDIHMPGLDGFDTTRAIRALPGGDQIRIAAVSASELDDVSARAREAGMDDYVAKPLTPQKLDRILERADLPRAA